MAIELRIGDEIEAEIIEPDERRGEWRIACRQAPRGWQGKLTSRAASLYAPGDQDWFWVYRTNPREQRYWVSDSDFGRLPISDKLRPRYIRAARAFMRIVSGKGTSDPALLDDLSEMKGILNRCRRQDQGDWFTLYQLLEEPSTGILEIAAFDLHETRKALRLNDSQALRSSLDRLSLAIAPSLIARFVNRLEESAPKLRQVRATPRGETEGSELAAATVTLSYEAKVKHERASDTHTETLNLLCSVLSSHGYIVEHNKLVDAFCRLKTGPALFEVKSITPANERSQCRHALSQLYEYRYLHGLEQATLWIVLSAKPSADWIVDYLASDRGINLVWHENGGLGGPSFKQLL